MHIMPFVTGRQQSDLRFNALLSIKFSGFAARWGGPCRSARIQNQKRRPPRTDQPPTLRPSASARRAEPPSRRS